MAVEKMPLQLILFSPSKDEMLVSRVCGAFFAMFALYAAFSDSEFAIKVFGALLFSASALFMILPPTMEVILDKATGQMQITRSSIFSKSKEEYPLKDIEKILVRETTTVGRRGHVSIQTEAGFLLKAGRQIGFFSISARSALISQINIRTENPSAEQLSKFLGVPVKIEQEDED